jgi:hypothetical protein
MTPLRLALASCLALLAACAAPTGAPPAAAPPASAEAPPPGALTPTALDLQAPAAAARPAPVAGAHGAPHHAVIGKEHPSADARRVADWVVDSRDNGSAPFAVIDKHLARLWVFDASGHLKGAAPVLLGAQRGDDTVPGIGEKAIKDVLPSERTTPAGRFVAEHGTNMRHEHVIWVDYDDAVSMHPVLTTNPKEHRLQRMASRNPADHRISYGCINVPKAFFHKVVLNTLSAPHPVIYILPEVHPLRQVFADWYPVRHAPVRQAHARKAPAGAKTAAARTTSARTASSGTASAKTGALR